MRSLLHHRPAPQATAPVLRPTGVDAAPLGCATGTGALVIAELRALDDAPVPPTAVRRAFDSRTWVPSLRKVPLTPRPSLAAPELLAADDAADALMRAQVDAIRAVHDSGDVDTARLVEIALARVAAMLEAVTI